jgi:hypothetical protein
MLGLSKIISETVEKMLGLLEKFQREVVGLFEEFQQENSAVGFLQKILQKNSTGN